MSRILIHNGAVLTSNGWIDRGYVTLDNGIIQKVSIGKPSEKMVKHSDEIIDARNCAVLPGLVNGHTHLSQTFMRGLARGLPLIRWLKEVIWPMQAEISPEEIHLAALLGLVENIRSGVTSIFNHHKITSTQAHTNKVLKAAEMSKLRFTLARSWSDKGKNREDPERIISDMEGLFERWHGKHNLRIANGPLALWRCSEDSLTRTRELALRYDSVTHFHVSESQDEVRLSVDEYGQRPIGWLESIGVLGPDTQIVHAVWVNEEEIESIANAGAPVVHCPVSNAVLGSGIAPVNQMLKCGIKIILGTDGPASNDTQDVWGTIKSAVSFARATTLDPTVLPPKEALLIATGGVTLKAGNLADLIVVRLDHPRVVPVHDYDSALVLGTHSSDVETVIVGGKILMKNKQVIVVDETILLEECRHIIKQLRMRTGLE